MNLVSYQKDESRTLAEPYNCRYPTDLVKFIKMKVGIRQRSEVQKRPKMAFSKRKNSGI